ncbi:MAG: M1 family metallopeptidase [Kofleriaceae bacterium]
MRLNVLGLVAMVAACPAREPIGERQVVPAVPVDAAPKPPARRIVAPVNARLPEGITPLSYDVRLELDPDREAFRGRVTIRVVLAAATDRVWLHAEGLVLATARYRTTSNEGALTERLAVPDQPLRELAFGATLQPGEVTLAFDYTGHLGNTDEGLFRQKFDGRWFVYAQSQARFARRILPCFDEPRFKVPWRVTLVVPEKLVALANGAVASERQLPDRRREVTFAEVAPLPSYLFSVAVGPFALVDAGTVGKHRVPVRVAVAPAAAKQAGVVAARLPAIVDALERYTGQPLAWPKLDLVAVPSFFGAMENVGLITFDVDILVGDLRSPRFARKFVRFAAHELAHQWFGNLVTPAWWDDLWLSEGLASWMGDKLSLALGGFDDPDLALAFARREAIAADTSPAAIPLHRTIAGDADADDRFDAISYEKGAAVLAMFERFVGEPAFQRAIQHYVTTHGRGSATSADFLASIATVAPQLTGALGHYLDHAGLPIVELAVRCEASPAIELRARAAAIPVCLRYGTRAGAARACALATDPPAKLALTECPTWLAGNAGGLGYYRVAQPIVTSARAPLTITERLAHGDDVAAALVRGELAVDAALGELRRLVEQRTPESRLAALAIASSIGPVIEDVDRPAWWRWLAARFADQLAPAPMFAPKTTLAREQRDALLGNLPAAQFPAPTIAAARASVERALAKGASGVTRARARGAHRWSRAVRSLARARDRVEPPGAAAGVVRDARILRRRARAARRRAGRDRQACGRAHVARARDPARTPEHAHRDLACGPTANAADPGAAREGRPCRTAPCGGFSVRRDGSRRGDRRVPGCRSGRAGRHAGAHRSLHRGACPRAWPCRRRALSATRRHRRCRSIHGKHARDRVQEVAERRAQHRAVHRSDELLDRVPAGHGGLGLGGPDRHPAQG